MISMIVPANQARELCWVLAVVDLQAEVGIRFYNNHDPIYPTSVNEHGNCTRPQPPTLQWQ